MPSLVEIPVSNSDNKTNKTKSESTCDKQSDILYKLDLDNFTVTSNKKIYDAENNTYRDLNQSELNTYNKLCSKFDINNMINKMRPDVRAGTETKTNAPGSAYYAKYGYPTDYDPNENEGIRVKPIDSESDNKSDADSDATLVNSRSSSYDDLVQVEAEIEVEVDTESDVDVESEVETKESDDTNNHEYPNTESTETNSFEEVD